MDHPTTTPEQWLEARKALLAKEKALTKLKDELAQARLELPWVEVTKPYVFQGPEGPLSFADLFDGRSQLVIYHFMFDPAWEEGCPGCSFLADHLDGPNRHLPHKDVTLAVVSRAPYSKLQAYKNRMRWQFPWYSSEGSDFNYDYHVSFRANIDGTYNFAPTSQEKDEEAPGTSCFYKDETNRIYHTYSSYARGGEDLLTTYAILDLAPLGRNEDKNMEWLRRNDQYGQE